MRRAILVAVVAAAVIAGTFGPARAQEPIKVGLIAPFSGTYASAGRNYRAGIDAYLAAHPDAFGGRKVTFVYKDLEQPNPAQAKALAQELIVKDKVGYLMGLAFTPEALAVAPLLESGNVPLILLNGATSAITQKSPLIVRMSFTTWQTTVPMAKAAHERGIGKVLVVVSDYGPGLDAEAAFKSAYGKLGGTVVDAIRIPLKTTDFNPIIQRIKDSGAEAVFAFIPAGPSAVTFVKTFAENGLKERGIKLLATGDLVDDANVGAIGDDAVGILSTFHYSLAHPSALNARFVRDARQALGGSADELSFSAVAAYDGMRVLDRMIVARGGAQDAAKAVDAVKGMSFESPRGPLVVDAATRSPRQTVYLRSVEKDGARLVNKEVASFPDIPDLGQQPGN